MTSTTRDGKKLLQRIARHAMTRRGLLPDFSPAALQEAGAIAGAAVETGPAIRVAPALRPGQGSLLFR